VNDREMLQRETADAEAHIARIAAEFRVGFEVVARIGRLGVAIFGSARLPASDPACELAARTAAAFAAAGFAVVTGGGPGVMEAANRGAREAGGFSVGFSISLPREEAPNAYLDLSHTFHHFYARKTMFVKAAEGFVVFPGGFGTLDELFESLTLIQTHKIGHFPVILMGAEHWQPLLRWIDDRLRAPGLISAEDLRLLRVTDDPAVAVQQVQDCLRGVCEHAA
jgi:uncharacterized protein (TIGR00730 family)